MSYKNKCDHCHRPFGDIKYDAMTIFGPWADLCEDCFKKIGIGLGIGLGQQYEKHADKWIKTGG